VRLPVAAIIGSRDEYLDRRPQELLQALQRNAVRARSFTGVIIRGAQHGFPRRERELADVIVRWLRDARRPRAPGR
jgi:dienelactone hydrolase